MKRYYVFFAIIISIAVAAATAQSITSVGYQQDTKNEADLQSISIAVTGYGSAHKALPTKLEQLTFTEKLNGKLTDYQYKVKTYNTYQLCATFKHESKAPTSSPQNSNSYYTNTQYHKVGNDCLDFSDQTIEQPVAIVPSLLSSTSCAAGPRDQKVLVPNLTWVSFDPIEKMATVNNGSTSQTFRWCQVPTITNDKGVVIAISAIPAGAKVTFSVTVPSKVNANQTISPETPYVTAISATSATSVQ